MKANRDENLNVLVVEGTQNTKLGDMAATYAPIKNSCPDSCPLKNEGCYAQWDYIGQINKMLESPYVDEIDVAKQEADEIENLIEDYDQQDNDQVVKKMKDIVPEFKSNNSVFSKFDA